MKEIILWFSRNNIIIRFNIVFKKQMHLHKDKVFILNYIKKHCYKI